MNKVLADLIRISNITGKNPALVQGGGGNTSVKTADGEHMFIKSSGTALKDMNSKTGWRKLRLESVLSIVKDEALAQLDTNGRETEVVSRLLGACEDNVTGGARPSVEAHLHAFLDNCVIHLHPNAAGVYVNAKNGKAELEKLFKDQKPPVLWVSYATPGFALAKKLAKAIVRYQNLFGEKPAVIFLQKHGVVVSAKSPNVALRLVRKVINRCSAGLKYPKIGRIKSINPKDITDMKLCIRRAFFEATGRHTVISYSYDEQIAAFWRQRDARRMLLPLAITPAELLYANGAVMWVAKCDSKKIAERLSAQIKKGRKPSAAFLVKGVGLFIAAGGKKAAVIRDVVKNSLFIRSNAFRMGGISSLNKRERDIINRWEAEAFRKE